MKTKIQLFFTVSILCLSTLSYAQLVGGRANGESSPSEVKPSAINAGGFSGDVSLFSGTYNSSYSLGSVSTPTGLSYSVNLNYSSSFSTGDNLPHTSGIPYGEGWSIDMPSISISIKDYLKYVKSQINNDNPHWNITEQGHQSTDSNDNKTYYTQIYTDTEAQEEGRLYWYAPTLNIPGIASGRMVFKYMKSGNIPVFVLHQFDKYVEAEYDAGSWKITLDDGTKYYFSVLQVSNRNASNQRNIPAENNEDALRNSILPKTEVAVWYISRIQHPYEIDGITFDYYTFGEFNYYKELEQEEIQEYCIDSYLYNHGGSTGNPGGQIRLNRTFKEIFLKEVNSGYDKLVFKHESITTIGGNKMMNLSHSDVSRKDSLYSYQVVYDTDDASNEFDNNWNRYYHTKADEIQNNFTAGINMASSSNPYLGQGGGYNSFQSFYTRKKINNSNGIATFDHGFLESERIGSGSPSNSSFPSGDLYEIRTEVYHPDYNNSGEGFLNLDINIVSGDMSQGTGEFPSGQVYEFVDNTKYNINRGSTIFTTFNQAIKWNTKDANGHGEGNNSASLQTSNFFTMPNLPLDFNGFHIQVGPGNSDQIFNIADNYSGGKDLVINEYNTNFRNLKNTYSDYLSPLGIINPDLSKDSYGFPGLKSGAPMSRNFGIGYPWRMMAKFYGYNMEPAIDLINQPLGTGFIYNNGYRGSWWTNIGNPANPLDNIPTLADNTVELRNVKLIRYTKNPFMLKEVKYYKASDENTDINNLEEYNWSLISKEKFNYEIQQAPKFVNVYDAQNNIHFTEFKENRNVVLLKKIQKIPGDLPTNFNLDDTPTTLFDYTTKELVDNSGNSPISQDVMFIPGITSIPGMKFNTNCILLSSVTNQLGGITEVEYGETYAKPLHLPRSDYYKQKGPKYRKVNPPVIQFFVTVAKKHIIDKDYNTTFEYEFSDLTGYLNDLEFGEDGHFRDDYSYKSVQGYKETKVYQPELETANRPYIIYKHYTLDNSLQPNAPKDIYWGKVHKVENYDGAGNLISTTENIYDYTLAFKTGALRHRNVFDAGSDINKNDYYDYEAPSIIQIYDCPTCPDNWILPSTPYNINRECDSLGGCSREGIFRGGISKMENTLNFKYGGFDNPRFYDIYFIDEIIENNPYHATFFNSYFVKKISEINTVYDENCSAGVIIEGSLDETEKPVHVIETQIDYEYHEIDYNGYTANEALMEIANLASTPNERLFMEPSWQLYKKKTTSPQYPDAYVEERTYFYYDLINNIDEYADYSLPYKAKEHFHVLQAMYQYRIRNIPFEVRNIVKMPNKAAVINATYYEYTDDWDYFVDYQVLSDTVFSPDYPCTSLGGGGSGVVDPNQPPSNCTVKVIDPQIQGYCLEPSYFPYGQVYCPCETAGGGINGVVAAVSPLVEPHSYLKAIYSQVNEVSNQNILKFKLDNSSYIFDFPNTLTAEEDVLKTKEILERNRKGLIHQEQDVNGIITQYNYMPITEQYLKYCHPTRLGEIAIERRIINMNGGLITSITIGEGRSDALTTHYTYNKDNTIATITDQNGGVLAYEYDEFARMSAASHNGDLLSEVNYHQWENVLEQSFEDRTMENYVETTIHNDLSGTNFTRVRAYMDPVGRNALTAAYASDNPNDLIISGHVEYDKWNREYKGFKPFEKTVGGNFNGLTYGIASTYANNNGSLAGNYPYTEKNYEDNPRSRVLKSSKFGLDINGSRVVANDYCVVNGADLVTELNLTTAEQSEIIPNSSSTGSTISIAVYKFLKTTITDEDGKWVTDYTNSIGQKVATLRNDGTSDVITLFVYDKAGNLTKVINPKKQESHYRYNYLGQLYEEETPDGGKKQLIYNKKGQVVFERDEMGYNNDYYRGYVYDDYGRMLEQVKITRHPMADPFFYFTNAPINPIDASLLFLSPYENTFLGQLNVGTPEKAWIYEDNINLTDATFIENGRIYLQNSLTNYKGQVTQTISYNLFGEPVEYKFFSYNDRGQLKWELIQFNNNGIRSTDKGLLSRIDYPKYNLRGSLQTMNVDLDGDHDLDLQYHYTYDQWNRLDEVFVSYDGQGANGTRVAKYYYDNALGHVTKVEYYDEEENCTKKVDETVYTYDIRDRLTTINSYLFEWNLFYDNDNPNSFITSGQSWNGNIRGSEGVYKFDAGNPHTITNISSANNFNNLAQSRYSYTYDNLNRLTNADANINGINITGTLSELGDVTYAFDEIGNLTKLIRKTLDGSSRIVTSDYRYNYQAGTNRLIELTTPIVQGGFISSSSIANYTYDDNGNLLSDTKRGLLNTVYGRANLPWSVNTNPGTTIFGFPSTIDYLYDVNDGRIFKSKVVNQANVTVEYYLKSSSGQDLAIYDFNSDEITWYLFGKERIGKFKHQYENAFNKVASSDVGFIEDEGLEDALVATAYHNQLTGGLELNLPDNLLLIELEDGTLLYILESQLDIIEGEYVILSSYTITSETNQFSFTMIDGSVRIFSLEEVLGFLGLFANDFTIGSGDPFEIPLTVPTTIEELDFHYYIYDHLGNTRIVYSTELVGDCNSESGVTPEYTLEAVMDYYPYGKILRQYIKTPEKYVTTHHERDEETGLDYRGARFYDSDVARFLSLDPLAAEFPAWSDYNYVLGNPVMLVDPDGKAPQPSESIPFPASAKIESTGFNNSLSMLNHIDKEFKSMTKNDNYQSLRDEGFGASNNDDVISNFLDKHLNGDFSKTTLNLSIADGSSLEWSDGASIELTDVTVDNLTVEKVFVLDKEINEVLSLTINDALSLGVELDKNLTAGVKSEGTSSGSKTISERYKVDSYMYKGTVNFNYKVSFKDIGWLDGKDSDTKTTTYSAKDVMFRDQAELLDEK